MVRVWCHVSVAENVLELLYTTSLWFREEQVQGLLRSSSAFLRSKECAQDKCKGKGKAPREHWVFALVVSLAADFDVVEVEELVVEDWLEAVVEVEPLNSSARAVILTPVSFWH